MVTKLLDFLASDSNPEVVLLGSSLTLIPSVRSDDQLTGRKTRYDTWYRHQFINAYPDAKYLRQLLQRHLGKDVHIANMAVTGAMVSDECLILEKLLASGKTPQVVVVEVAERGFLDKLRANIEKTPVYQVLADFRCLKDILKRNPSPQEIQDFVVGNLWYYYKVKADYRAFLAGWFSGVIQHPLNLWEAAQGCRRQNVLLPLNPENQWAALYTPLTHDHAKDMQFNHSIYNPPDMQLFAKQSWYMEHLLKIAHEAGITAVIVNMPMPRENTALIPAYVRKRYHHLLKSLSYRYQAVFLDLENSPDYQLTDFEDSSHMNASGGHKLFSTLAKTISCRTRISP
ncbi:MAG: DUF1574 family protein [Candidatus Melainabacteria bacterium]|nr:DUF1574 family protein [Candidatus Melainabacteria bacterium]